jgi:hypothetical protein
MGDSLAATTGVQKEGDRVDEMYEDDNVPFMR